uniref:POU class 2 homeobox associating factor 3 n=1 Tax=Anolis carolinensis TaxID=28377 RepID=R4GAA3_ANOCA|nr:PREDICTED: colorectal cancer-associated protein 2 [Anolis carolinensis]|eukprot:XP_008119289.1 PREDICTED: colorectal cancer-associated protein 2 [Anolis carolinensis]
MSGKPKVYQGVRVKITVKELLQQRRAKQAVAEDPVCRESCATEVQFTESFSPPCAAPFADADLEQSSSTCLQPWPFQNCLTCEEIPSYLEQLVDSCLQTEPVLDPALPLAQGHLTCPPGGYQPGPPPCLGTGSPDSSDPSSSFEYSFSPPPLPPFAPIDYHDSTSSSLEAKSCMYPSLEESSYPLPPHVQYNHVPAPCGCTSCGSQHLDTFRVSECFPYANADCREYVPSVSVADDFFRRDRSWDACYS